MAPCGCPGAGAAAATWLVQPLKKLHFFVQQFPGRHSSCPEVRSNELGLRTRDQLWHCGNFRKLTCFWVSLLSLFAEILNFFVSHVSLILIYNTQQQSIVPIWAFPHFPSVDCTRTTKKCNFNPSNKKRSKNSSNFVLVLRKKRVEIALTNCHFCPIFCHGCVCVYAKHSLRAPLVGMRWRGGESF